MLLGIRYPDSGTVAQGGSANAIMPMDCNKVCGYTEILDQLETSYVLVGSLIAVDTPSQIGWHLDNARRGGASLKRDSRSQADSHMRLSECGGECGGMSYRVRSQGLREQSGIVRSTHRKSVRARWREREIPGGRGNKNLLNHCCI